MFEMDFSDQSYGPQQPGDEGQDSVAELLREMVNAQNRQTELLQQLVQQMSAAGQQRANELGQWKEANPLLARNCHEAAEALSRVQMQFLQQLTSDVKENAEYLMDGEFVLNEFVDRYGPRLAHLNAVLQILSQLSSVPNPSNTQ